jgi:hypothetical protein
MTKTTAVNNRGIKIEDAGNIAPFGRVASKWADVETELIKFTKAATFNQKVQTSSEEFIKYFGIKGVEFGNWMSQVDRLEFLYGAAHAFEEMRKFLGVPAHYIGLGGELAIAFGARGTGFALAHYEPWSRAINITKPHGEVGALFHEYAHAVDNIVYQTIRQKHEPTLLNLGFASGGMTRAKGIDLDRLQRNDLIGLMENIFASTFWNIDGTKKKWLIDFLKSSDGNSDYYNRRAEMFARFSEVWCHQVADKINTSNKMLVQQKYEKVVYPPHNVISNLFDEFKQFYTVSLNFLNGKTSYKFSVDMPTPKTDKEEPKKKKIKLKRVAEKEPKEEKTQKDPEKTQKNPALETASDEKKLHLKVHQIVSQSAYKYKNGQSLKSIYDDLLFAFGAAGAWYFSEFAVRHKNDSVFMSEFNKTAFVENHTKNDKKKSAVSGKKIKINLGNSTEIDTQTENIKAKYALVELGSLIQSNDPITFKPNPDYPASCQTRNYNEIKGEQEKVIKYSSNFKPNHLINNSPDATTGSPIVTGQGIVLGGNGRTMILKRLKNDNWDKYEKLLTQKVNDFGISQDELSKFKKPVLVRVIENVSISKCSYYSDTLNSNTMQDFDPVTKSISIAKSMDTATFERIANIFEDTEGETFSQVLSVSTASKKIIDLLTDKKFINTSNRDVWLDGNGLSSKGKETLENVLLAYILPDKKLIEKAKVYTNKIVKALPLLVKIKQFKGQWNLIPDIQKVIELENSRRSTGQTKTDYLNQDDIFKKGKNPTVSEKEKLVWSLLDSGVLKFKEALTSYIRTHDNENSENAMFGGGNATPVDVLENLKKTKGLSDKYKRNKRASKKGSSTHAKPRKKRTTTKYEVEKLSDKPKKTRTTQKDIKAQALSIKQSGSTGREAWKRLERYMKQFDNVHIMWGEPSIHSGDNYTPLSKIISSDYFYAAKKENGLSDKPKKTRKAKSTRKSSKRRFDLLF